MVVSLEVVVAVVLMVEAMKEVTDVVMPPIKPGTMFLLVSYVAGVII
jgi:hypothetical protein